MIMEFSDKDQFKNWLSKNVKTHDGVWIRFYKNKKKASVLADEALDISLCYGWIDGQMKTEGENSYIKYFAPRSAVSKWSEKNKKSIERLRKKNLMTIYGEEAVKKAIENGQWEKEKEIMNFDTIIIEFTKLLSADKNILSKFNDCTLSVKKRYCSFYFDAKTDETRKKRLEKIQTALNGNFKGMLF
ncbi:MAG TPA: YdeI/OmpD-associated family protein [Chitinispirillaceae bacterium]|nr:YdeI/OmpD-associated family protein [Chitinispirillaceae bacterium]